MFQLTEPQKMIQEMMRQYVTKEIQPHVEAMEDGEMDCFDLARKMFKMLGVGAMAKPALEKLAKKWDEGEKGGGDIAKLMSGEETGGMGDDPMMMLLMVKEISKASPGFAMSFGVSRKMPSPACSICPPRA